ncbi:MAG: aldehyde reductase [Crocinitomicaceae bacterium]
MKTILVTGGTGYIGSWAVKELLKKGHTVRLASRNTSNKEKFKHLYEIAEKTDGKLEIYEANLLEEGSFDEAANGSDAIIHIASPFKINVKDAHKELIEPAKQGTQHVLSAATKSGSVKKVILTSSAAAIYGDTKDMKEQGLAVYNETHWNQSSSEKHQPYSYSKTVAEKTAWQIAGSQDQWSLVVINPTFVIGPSLTNLSSSESLNFMKDLLSGKFKMGAPELYFGFVDVRDVAHAHLLALENQEAEGRHIISNTSLSFLSLAKLVEKQFPGKYKLPKSVTPKFLMYLMGWMFGVSIKFIKNNVGYEVRFDNTKGKNKLGISYRGIDESVHDMVHQMEQEGVI